jgi:hypothetical protein
VARWTEDFADKSQVAIFSYSWSSVARSVSAFYTAPAEKCKFLSLTSVEGKGSILDPIFDVNAVSDNSYEKFLRGKVHWFE